VVFEVLKTIPEYLHPVLLARAGGLPSDGMGGCPAKRMTRLRQVPVVYLT